MESAKLKLRQDKSDEFFYTVDEDGDLVDEFICGDGLIRFMELADIQLDTSGDFYFEINLLNNDDEENLPFIHKPAYDGAEIKIEYRSKGSGEICSYHENTTQAFGDFLNEYLGGDDWVAFNVFMTPIVPVEDTIHELLVKATPRRWAKLSKLLKEMDEEDGDEASPIEFAPHSPSNFIGSTPSTWSGTYTKNHYHPSSDEAFQPSEDMQAWIQKWMEDRENRVEDARRERHKKEVAEGNQLWWTENRKASYSAKLEVDNIRNSLRRLSESLDKVDKINEA